MKTILATTYSNNPYKGSEEAMGWNYIYQAARFHKVIGVTRLNNRKPIEKFMSENNDPVFENISFLYYDLPYWMRFWKKGGRGVILYYLMWQYALPGFIKKQKLSFDVVHNMNFHNDWSPSFLWKLGKPFVWGPIGHHPRIPAGYLNLYPDTYKSKDKATWQIKKFFWNNLPALKKTVKKADYIWCMNNGVANVLNLTGKKHHISPSVATQDFGWNPQKENKKFTLISAGRLVPLKGYDLTILSFASFLNKLTDEEKYKCELMIVGSGAEEKLYQDLVEKHGIRNYVRFISWIERNDLMAYYKNASAFIFPSHEGAGMVVPEALSFGLPVLCLDNEGPGEFIDNSCGIKASVINYEGTVKELGDGIYKLFQNPEILKNMGLAARKKFETDFHWDRRGIQLREIYQNL